MFKRHCKPIQIMNIEDVRNIDSISIRLADLTATQLLEVLDEIELYEEEMMILRDVIEVRRQIDGKDLFKMAKYIVDSYQMNKVIRKIKTIQQ